MIATSGGVPPIANAALLLVPTPLCFLRAVFKLFTSVHEVPSHCSVSAVLAVPVYPPKATQAVNGAACDDATYPLAVFKSFTSVQAEPFQLSVTAM